MIQAQSPSTTIDTTVRVWYLVIWPKPNLQRPRFGVKAYLSNGLRLGFTGTRPQGVLLLGWTVTHPTLVGPLQLKPKCFKGAQAQKSMAFATNLNGFQVLAQTMVVLRIGPFPLELTDGQDLIDFVYFLNFMIIFIL